MSAWLDSAWMLSLLALAATVYYTLRLIRNRGGGGKWMNLLKVMVFAVLIFGGVWALPGKSLADVRSDPMPFSSRGSLGLFQVMGYSLIALQRFDLIPAVAGEIKDPIRNIPRSMLLSFTIALLISSPLRFMVTTVGMKPGQSVAAI